jgi:hypothetical protein
VKLILLLLAALLCKAQQTALDDYPAEKDDVFAWKLVSKSTANSHCT